MLIVNNFKSKMSKKTSPAEEIMFNAQRQIKRNNEDLRNQLDDLNDFLKTMKDKDTSGGAKPA